MRLRCPQPSHNAVSRMFISDVYTMFTRKKTNYVLNEMQKKLYKTTRYKVYYR